MTARAQALGLMLEEEEGGEGEEKISGARRLRAVTAVAVEWQRWQALEAEVRRAADEVLHASRAWRVAEGRYEAAGKLRRGLRSGSSKLNPWQIVPVVTVCDTS